MNRLAGIIFIMLMSFNAHGLGNTNPGESAEDCVEVSASNSSDRYSDITVKNTCNEKIFVTWCIKVSDEDKKRGMLNYKDSECASDSLRAKYYVNSLSFDKGGEKTMKLAGEFRYAACKGTYNTRMEFTDDAEGNFKCNRSADLTVQPKLELKVTSDADKKAADAKALAESTKLREKEEAKKAKEKLAFEKKQAEEMKAREDAERQWCMADRARLSACRCAKYNNNPKATACSQ